MDKRTILFVIALSLALLGMNIFFQYQNTQKKQEWLHQQQVKQAQKEKHLQEEVAQRTAQAEDLPLVKLYADQELKDFLTSGFFNQDNILSLSWTASLPKTVFAQVPESEDVKTYQLAYEPSALGTPVIYQSSPDKRLKAGNLPDFGRYDLQLVHFNEGDLHQPLEIKLGEYTDGHLSIPLASSWNQSEPVHKGAYFALALLKTPDGYLPVGLYDAQEKALVRLNYVPELAPFLADTKPTVARSHKKTEEKFYVLETPYQQLVFSNYGGALAEINLPFHTKENPLSVVREIQFDRDMVAHHPENAHFPAHPYYTSSTTQTEGILHEEGQLGGYYPLLRRDLIEKAPRQTIRIKPQYYALNIVSEYPELAELVYEVKHFDKQSITFEANQSHRRITKTYSLGDAQQAEGPYTLNLEIKIDGDTRGLWLTSGVPEVEWISGSPAPTLKYRLTRNQKSEVEKIELPQDSSTVTSVYLDWICNSNGFLGMILDPLKETDPGYRVQHVSGTTVPSRLVEIDQAYDRYKPANLPGYMTFLPLKAQGGGAMKFRFFAGPFDSAILKQVDAKYSDPATGYNPDYIACQSMHGWFTFISEPFAKFLFILLNLFHSFTGSWALSIILLTISLRLMLYPLNTWSTKSMVRMQQISPEVTAIQEKHKKDPKKAQIEIMNLYRERGVNPASGCLPLLIQMPFLIGMFDLLKSSFALRGAPFIPGWIDDLTAPDVLFRWNYPIFFIGTEFHLLPFLLGAVMFLQQRLMTTMPSDPSLMTDQQRQQRTMGTMMTVVFTVMFYNFPSGLNIYWLSSMLLGIVQQWYTTKQMQKQPVVLPPTTNSKTHPKKAKSR